MNKIELIAFDADDTLWHTESYFQDTQNRLAEILTDFAPADEVNAQLNAIERKNIKLFGFGIKGFTLSMIETAIEMSNQAVSAAAIHEIIMMGKTMLDAPLDLLPRVEDCLKTLNKDYRLCVITKGDLLDQTNKVDRSGLDHYFRDVEVVSHKTPEDYSDIFERYGIQAKNVMMIGNSIPSDILPVLTLGGFAVHIPYSITALHERHDDYPKGDRFFALDNMSSLPDIISRINKI
jgi:putative hydrolase of the HAD superfamily